MKVKAFVLCVMVAMPFAAAATETFGDGADGPANYGVSQALNTPEATITSTVLSGATIIQVSSTAGFVPTSEVMLITLHGAGAGNYEFARILSVGASSLTLTAPTTNGYSAVGAVDSHVYKVWNHSTFTIGGGVVLTPSGSVTAIRAMTSITINGDLNEDFRGFGGSPIFGGGNGGAGYSYNGDPTPSASSSANFGGGGGGEGSGTGAGGGAGAGHSALGGAGASANSNIGGQGGGFYGVADLSTIFMGSGGGGSARVISGANSGGAGGGIIILAAPSITIGGTISVWGDSGFNGSPAVLQGVSATGGGSGGSILLTCSTSGAVNVTGSVDATGGPGGTGGIGTLAVGDGGDGADGRIRINGSLTGGGTVVPAPSLGPGVAPPASASSWTLYD